MAHASSSKSTGLSAQGFDEYNAQLQGIALKATKTSAALPLDLAFYRTVDRGLAKEVDACSARVLSITNKLLDLVSTGEQNASRAKGKARLENQDDVVDDFHSLVVDAMDHLLERADICLDEFLGLSKKSAIAVNPAQSVKQKTKKQVAPTGRLDPALQHASHLAKPQTRFTRKVDNSNYTAWQPTLRHKYNAQVPLGYASDQNGEETSRVGSLHPYYYEIKHISYPPSMFRSSEPIPPKSFEDTPFAWVSSSAEFASMLDSLRGAKEIAIDLEHHSYRSYAGFVCLMQISTRHGDWVVDTLTLREELEELNEVFADPKIVKVLHGAESDILWLQQNFNLYIVNLFDTYHASRILELPRHNLATLLEMYCDFTADKRFQLADWRIRPLPQEMLHYARSDTHFLLFIYDNLRNALLDRAQSRVQSRPQSPSIPDANVPPTTAEVQSLVREVLSRSEETALRVYEKELYDAERGSGPSGWDTLAKKWNKGSLMAGEGTGGMRREVYKCVHGWRDRVAREEDESTRYVLPNHYLFMLAERPPADMVTFLSMFQSVPPVIRRRAKELLDEIRGVVKQYSAPASTERNISTPAPEVARPEGGISADKMDVDAVTPTLQIDASSAKLWPTSSQPAHIQLSSSLFGSSLTAPKLPVGTNTYATSSSSLFARPSSSSSAPAQAKLRFQSLAARIHNSLTIAHAAPPIPTVVVPESNAADGVNIGASAASKEKEEEAVSEQVEIPFVPSAQRQSVKPIAMADDIIVVGQHKPKQKKRKRSKQRSLTNTERDQATASTPSGDNGSDFEQFDYSTAPNILDEGSDHEGATVERSRKKKQRAQGGFQLGAFRAPPKAHSQLKTGNQSRTFK